MDEMQCYERLVRGGVAPRRARRALRELAEHRQDIIAERLQLGETPAQSASAAHARLGSPQILVEGMLARPELKSWARRKPWAAFALTPLLGFCALFVGISIATVMMVSGLKSAVGDLRFAPQVTWLTEGAALLVLWGAPIGVAALLAMAAVRRRESSLWPAAGILLVSVIGACTNFQFVLPSSAEPPELSVGIGVSSAALVPVLARSALCGALTLLPYLWTRRLLAVAQAPKAP